MHIGEMLASFETRPWELDNIEKIDKLNLPKLAGFSELPVGRNAVKAVDHLRIHRMLYPECAVLVEHRDAICWGNKVGACGAGGGAHEIEDRLLCRAVIP